MENTMTMMNCGENFDRSGKKSPLQILKEIKMDEGYMALAKGNEPVYFLVDTQDENRVYLLSTQKEIENLTESMGAVVKQSNVSTHKDSGTLSRNRWLIFSKKCVCGEAIFHFNWKTRKKAKK